MVYIFHVMIIIHTFARVNSLGRFLEEIPAFFATTCWQPFFFPNELGDNMATCSKHGCMLPFISLVSWWLASSLPGCFTFVAAYDPRCAAAAEGVSCNSEDPCRSDT